MDYPHWTIKDAHHVVWFDYSSLNMKFREGYYCQVAIAAQPDQTYPDGPIMTMHVTIPLAESSETRSFCGPFYRVVQQMRNHNIDPALWLGANNYYTFVSNFYAHSLSIYSLSWIAAYMQDLQPIETVHVSNLISDEVASDLNEDSDTELAEAIVEDNHVGRKRVSILENEIDALYFTSSDSCDCDICTEQFNANMYFDIVENQMEQSFV